MKTILFELTEGWTAQLLVQLLLNSATFDATGMLVEAVLRDRHGNRVTVPCIWQTEATSLVAIDPVAATFTEAKSPYTIRFKVTDVASEVAFFPPGDSAQISVYTA